MNTASPIGSAPAFPLQELEQIDAALRASAQWAATLEQRRALLLQELDRITTPTPAPAARPQVIARGLTYRGQHVGCPSYIAIHLALLRRLWADFPDRREAMAAAMAQRGTTRQYIARSPADLFAQQPDEFAERHSRCIADGWYADTNLNLSRIKLLMAVATRVAGLGWGADVKAYWRTTRMDAQTSAGKA